MSRISETLSSIGSQGAVTFDSLRRLGEAIQAELDERDVVIEKRISNVLFREEQTTLAPPIIGNVGDIEGGHN